MKMHILSLLRALPTPHKKYVLDWSKSDTDKHIAACQNDTLCILHFIFLLKSGHAKDHSPGAKARQQISELLRKLSPPRESQHQSKCRSMCCTSTPLSSRWHQGPGLLRALKFISNMSKTLDLGTRAPLGWSIRE